MKQSKLKPSGPAGRMCIEGKKIFLRKLRMSDAKDVYDNVKDDEIARFTVIPQPYPKDGAQKFIRKSLYNLRKGKEYVFAIIPKEAEGKAAVTRRAGRREILIGAVTLVLNKNPEKKSAELGYWLGKKHWGKGIMTEAAGLAIKFGFEVLKLHRIQAHAFMENPASARVIEKNGLMLEGIVRHGEFKQGKWHDERLYSILEHEYGKRRKSASQ